MLPVPCHDSDQPPVWLLMLSALLPTTSTREVRRSGSTRSLFFSSTSELRTASRATVEASSAAGEPACWRCEGLGSSNTPARSFTLRIRLTASSIRDIGISPDSTCAVVVAMNALQSFGTMITSRPALIACGQLAFVQPGTWPMPFQSETTTPSKPSLPLRTSVSIARLPCILPTSMPISAFVQLLNEAMTVWAPAASAP